MENTLLYAIVLLQLVVAILCLLTYVKASKNNDADLSKSVEHISALLQRLEGILREEFRTNRNEFTVLNKENRMELDEKFQRFSSEQRQKTDELKTEQKELSLKTSDLLEKLNQRVEERLRIHSEQLKTDNFQLREIISSEFKGFQEAFEKNVRAFNDLQREKFTQLESRQTELVKHTEAKLESIRHTVEEKLEKTLSERLGQSFETVGKQLIEVQKGLGEMQTIAQDVGGLKRVLSNVKMRGGIGEVQLSMLLEQILAPDQYEANVKTKPGSAEVVEFAIKLPGQESHQPVWIPIDAKFPKEYYEHLQMAYDAADADLIEAAQRNLENAIKKMAKDIRDKYVNPPTTTDFAILFLPFEGIYAEVVRKAALLEELQRTYKVVVTGPTTLAAILNSLQMGFRTLAIQKRSSEVWTLLGHVKKEFENFGGMLNKAQKNFESGIKNLEQVIGPRTRKIQYHLRNVQSLEGDSTLFLEANTPPDDTERDEFAADE